MVTSGEPAFDPYDHVAPPFGTPSWVFFPLFYTLWPLTIASLPLAVVAVVVRYRRSAGQERKQLQWLLLAVSLLPLAFATGALAELIDSEATEWLANGAFLAFALGVPVAVAVALTRYRLYEIDWIVNRTLVYAALTAVLAGRVDRHRARARRAGRRRLAVDRGDGDGGRGARVQPPAGRASRRLVDRRFARARFEGVRRAAGVRGRRARGPRAGGGRRRRAARGARRPDGRRWRCA